MYHDIFCCQGVVAEQSVSFSEALRMAPDPQLAVTPTPGAEEVWPLHKTAFSLFKPHVCVQYMYINIAANTVSVCAISAVFSVPQSHVINLWDYRHVCVCDIDTWSRWHFHAAEHTHVTWILRFCSVLIGRTLFTSHWIFIKSLVLLTHTDIVKTMTGAGSDRDAGLTQDLFHLLYPKHTSDFRHARDFFLKWLRVDECVCVCVSANCKEYHSRIWRKLCTHTCVSLGSLEGWAGKWMDHVKGQKAILWETVSQSSLHKPI